MRILGLHFGHDAAATVVVDGGVRSYVMRERHSRVKHAIGLTAAEIDACLADAGIEWNDIDHFAVTSTQDVELLTGLVEGLSLRYVDDHDGPLSSSMAQLIRRDKVDHNLLLGSSLRRAFAEGPTDDFALQVYKLLLREGETLDWSSLSTLGSMEQFVILADWAKGEGLATIGRRIALVNEELRRGFHYPMEMVWRGRRISGIFLNHHAAHAASSFYWSGFDRAGVLTHDGFGQGVGYRSGLYWYGEGGRLWPLWPHHLAIGGIYDYVAWKLGLGMTGGAGKLMGLAPYGKPRFFRRRFAGNWFDWQERFGAASVPGTTWWEHCVAEARRDGYDMEPLGDPSRATAAVNVDIAASTQKLFEESYLLAVEALRGILDNTGHSTRKLCLSGGTALNCPSNSRLFNESAFTEIFVEPGCDDSGLAIGAAFFLEHNVLDRPVPPTRGGDLPFLGVRHRHEAIDAALETAGGQVAWLRPGDLPQAVADDLNADLVVAWYEGRSEIGPRALGHRSIFCDPRNAENWARVNRIKGRELWRPFAPAVAEGDAADWFEGAPDPSPFMLFTAQVPNNRLPAIRHIDGSARIQSVPEGTTLNAILKAWKGLSGIPVVMNTSLNGPGEPIVETPAQALALFLSTDLDVLYLDGLRVVKNAPSGSIR